jgi:iron-sulfur cluster repair protein YtfE (RIC family)
MTSDPLRILSDRKARLSEWLSAAWENSCPLDCEAPPREVLFLQRFLRRHVLDHFELQQRVIFPALLEADPRQQVAELVAELRDEQRGILNACAELLSELALSMAHEDASRSVRAQCDRTRQLLDTLLANAHHEDTALLPLVREHRDVIADRLRAA